MNLRDIYIAGRRLRHLVRHTPLHYSWYLSKACGGRVMLKLENLQYTGSFKVRGAFNKLLQLSIGDMPYGIIAASSGNHAQGLGYVCNHLGVEATIIVPLHTPRVKIEAIRKYGVDLILHGEEYMEAERLARKMGLEQKKPFISGYNDPQIIEGQGTLGLEMLESTLDFDIVLVPVGGGGLISGVGAAVKGTDKNIEVVGVQTMASPVMSESLRMGSIVDMPLRDSIAEGLHGGIEESSITFEICKKHVDGFILVREKTILKAISNHLQFDHQVVEGAGAVGAAAIIENPERFKGKNVGVVVSGGNIDEGLLKQAANIM
ncbi:MAG: threonine/serine dehydratase [Candidatus Bathyarchaeota archaeon]|jgi:threonine dehydratase|nr:threonine/serine dehydratase [Candidatus Bathyarchaeota archaeon]MDP7443376.1 threonine/serine dehydratase [Candidatus Bathyarchaeota archaeon]|tara:strand:- start:110 stop:1066 length:957 start_codon:yes stop_codon:yes gene_type:complete